MLSTRHLADKGVRRAPLASHLPRYRVDLARDADTRGAASIFLGAEDSGCNTRCEHLVVHDVVERRLVGAQRVLTPVAAKATGTRPVADVFALDGLCMYETSLLEAGPVRLDPEHDNAAVAALMLLRLVELMGRLDCRLLLGRATLPPRGGDRHAANLYRQIGPSYLAPAELRATPKIPLPLAALATDEIAEVPPQIKGYLRAGAWIGAEPAWLPPGDGAEFLLLLPIARMTMHFQRRFLLGKDSAEDALLQMCQ